MYDFAVAGAGPAGLSAAITAAGAGHSVIVIEKGAVAGPEPRGESMPHHDMFDRLIRPDFLQSISSFVSSSRRFHSPGNHKSCLVKVKEPYYFFEWRDLIDPLYEKAKSLGVKFIFNAEVTAVKLTSDRASGLYYRVGDKTADADALTVLGCGGGSCPVASHYGINVGSTACPTVKFRGKLNKGLPASIKSLPGSPDLQFFTILPRSFKSVPGFPPGFAYIFPLDDTRIEAGLMLRLSQFEKLKDVAMPSDAEVMSAWAEAKECLPGFSDFFTDTETEYEKLTAIQNRRFITGNIMPGGGAVLIGDAVGMVDANGSAGLYYAMAQSAGWVEMLSNSMKAGKSDLWTENQIKQYYKTQASWDFYRYIKGSFDLISIFERIIFRTFGTEKKLNAVWPLISFLLKTAS